MAGWVVTSPDRIWALPFAAGAFFCSKGSISRDGERVKWGGTTDGRNGR